MAVGVDDEADERTVWWGERAMGDEVGVDDRVEEMVVYRVVDVGILIVITPFRASQSFIQLQEEAAWDRMCEEDSPSRAVREEKGVVAASSGF